MDQFKNRSFLKLLDYTPEEIGHLLDLAAELKAKKKAGIPHRLCEGKSVALIFEKTSTRTRCSFEVAAADLGMHPVYLDPKSSQIGKKRASPIPPGCWAACSTASSTAAMGRRSWRRWRSMPVCRCSTG